MSKTRFATNLATDSHLFPRMKRKQQPDTALPVLPAPVHCSLWNERAFPCI
jgi:hypothetical protein